MKKLWIFGFVLLLVVGCVSEQVGLDTEYLGTVNLPPEDPNNGILVPTEMLELELGNSPNLSETPPCTCEWEIRETSDGLVCLSEICSETCEISRCRNPIDVCQPL